MKLIIEVINGKWHVNGKLLHELSPNEKNALDQFIKSVDYGKRITPTSKI